MTPIFFAWGTSTSLRGARGAHVIRYVAHVQASPIEWGLRSHSWSFATPERGREETVRRRDRLRW